MKYIMIILSTVLFFGCSSPQKILNGETATTNNSYSSDYSCTTELEWNSCDLKPYPNFQDTNQIIKWGKNLGSANIISSKNIFIKNRKIFILIANAGNWFIYYSIYFFAFNDEIWQFITCTNANVKYPIKIKVDNEQEKIIFLSQDTQIGELPFDVFDKLE